MKYEKLFEPIKFGQLTSKNRINSAPTLGFLVPPDGHADQETIDFFRAKAKGGAGIVTVGESAVDRERGISLVSAVIWDNDRVIPSWNAVAEVMHRYGALASVELAHPGAHAYPPLIGGRQPMAPSAIASRVGDVMRSAGQSEEMTKAMIEDVIEKFGQAALRLKRAGFDMVLIHGGHGWLLTQFLSPYTNHRSDEYGGILENRARFPIRVVEHIRELCGPEFGIEYRMSGDECFPGGLSLEEAVQFAKLIESKVDIIHVSAGSFTRPETVGFTHLPSYVPRGINVPLAAAIKQAVSIPVATVGGILDPDMAEKILQEGKADIIVMARSILADPQWPVKAYSGRTDEIVPCTRCLECLARENKDYYIRCAVNPVLGRETEFSHLPKPEVSKRVAVVGGGPAGMQAAITAAARGHQVTLFEKTSQLGGNYALAVIPPFKDDAQKYLENLIARVHRLPIEVKLSTAVDAKALKSMNFDAAIVAVGADPLAPAIPGIDGPGVVHVDAVLTGQTKVGDKVVIAGGGLVGCETALYLAQQGKKVVILEMLDEVAPDLNSFSRIPLLLALQEQGVEIKTGAKITGISPQGVKWADKAANIGFESGDTVVTAFGFQARTALVDQLKSSTAEVYVIGDGLKARKLIDATREGYEVATEL